MTTSALPTLLLVSVSAEATAREGELEGERPETSSSECQESYYNQVSCMRVWFVMLFLLDTFAPGRQTFYNLSKDGYVTL